MAAVDILREKSKWRRGVEDGSTGGGGGSSFVTEETPGGEPVDDANLGDVSLLVTAANTPPGSNSSGEGNPIAADIGGVTFSAVTASGGEAAVVDGDGPYTDDNYILIDDATGLVDAQYVYDPVSAPFDAIDFQGDDFTIEFHFRSPVDSSTFRDVLGAYEFTERLWKIQINAQSGDFRSTFGWSTTGSDNNGGGQVLWGFGAFDTWYHVAIVREGADIRTYIDGTQVGITENISTDVIFSGDSPFGIGGDGVGGGNFEFNMAQVRITKGVARYTSNFTAPSAPYQGSDTILVIGDAEKRIRLDAPAIQNNGSLYIAEKDREGVINGYGQFQAQTSDGALAWSNSNDVKYRVAGDEDVSTTAALNSLSASINTTGKFPGRRVFNTDTNTPVWATGGATGDVWVDGTGSTAHTPV